MRYQINKGSKAFGASIVFQDIQFEIRNNEKIAVVGRNGCGKTTLLRVIADSRKSLTADRFIKRTMCGSAIWHRRPYG